MNVYYSLSIVLGFYFSLLTQWFRACVKGQALPAYAIKKVFDLIPCKRQ